MGEIRALLPSLRAVVDVAYAGGSLPASISWARLISESGPLEFEPVSFDHPLYVLFSSGTTGLPKAIVHGHGGILLEHLKALVLHHDLGPGDRFFWFSTTGWMMWNLLVSGLCTGASIVVFDGDPGWPGLDSLWRMAAREEVSFFGASAPFLLACRKAGLDLSLCGDLSALRSVGSTGAPLPPEGFHWVYEQLPGVWLTSISGGTDVCTAFVGGSPLLPVVAGEMACRYLGCAVAAFDEEGHSRVGEQGELVILEPMPSMPIRFVGDVDGRRYRGAYFARYPGLWCHGDWITITEQGRCLITGRSDATLNRGGVRLGSSEFYSVVEAIPQIADSLVVHLDGEEMGRLLLFVELAPGSVLDDALRARLAGELRSRLSPRHVPDEIHAVPGIPRTHSGKKLEIPVKRILMGVPVADVVSLGSLAVPSSMDAFAALAALAARTEQRRG